MLDFMYYPRFSREEKQTMMPSHFELAFSKELKDSEFSFFKLPLLFFLLSVCLLSSSDHWPNKSNQLGEKKS